MAAGPLLGSPLFMTDPRAALRQFAGALELVEPSTGLEWLRVPLRALIDLVRAAAG